MPLASFSRFALAGFLTCIAPYALADSHCVAGAPMAFASCPKGAARHFREVLVAVHGWNGSCQSTFGDNRYSLFSYLRSNAFYDVDCFAYDTDTKRVADSARALVSRLNTLKRAGYRRAMFVTHSTGGVVLLRAMTNLTLDEAGRPLPDETVGRNFANVPEFAGALIFAAPLRGLKEPVASGSALAGWLFGSATLNDIRRADSNFLVDLNARLGTIAGMSVDRLKGTGYRNARLDFLHGQDNDWVVGNINFRDPDIAGWTAIDLPKRPYTWAVATTDIAQGHTENVARAVRAGSPPDDSAAGPLRQEYTLFYPGRLLESLGSAELGFEPRDFSQFGPEGLRDRQLKVSEAMENYYAGPNPRWTQHAALVDYLTWALGPRTRRDRDADKRLAEALKASASYAEARNRDGAGPILFCRRLLETVETQYQPATEPDTGRVDGQESPSELAFGRGSDPVVAQLIDAMTSAWSCLIRLRNSVESSERPHVDRDVAVGGYAYAEFLKRNLEALRDPPKVSALTVLRKHWLDLRNAGVPVSTWSGSVFPRLRQNMEASVRSEIARIALDVAQTGTTEEKIRIFSALTALDPSATARWLRLGTTEDDLAGLLDVLLPVAASLSPEDENARRFVIDVVAKGGGRRAVNVAAMEDALQRFTAAITDPASGLTPEERMAIAEELRASGSSSVVRSLVLRYARQIEGS